MGWGPGKSRVIDEKRHFQKPIELSPLVAIDRERCILCYRCVRFSQEVAEDEQLQLLERGDRTFVGTFDDRPYIAPFHGNITDLCPVGALTSYTYRFRARPWDIEQAGSVCTLCPSQCNVSFTVRDEQVKRVIARDNAEVDDGWLCDRGRYGFEMFTSEQRVSGPRGRGGELEWRDAIEKAAAGLWAGKGACAAIVGDASNEEGYLVQRILREALDSPNIDSRVSRGPGRDALLALAQPEIGAKVRDIDEADVILVLGTDPLHSSPILDLRIRKAMRRNGARLALATERPTPLDGGAEAIARFAPGEATHFLVELERALAGDETVATPLATTLKDAGKVVVVWGERIVRNDTDATALLKVAAALGDGCGLLEVPDLANARGLREAGCLPDAGPGLTSPALMSAGNTNAGRTGLGTEEIREALISGKVKSLVLFGVDPLRDFPDTEAWKTALAAADHIVTFSTFENATTAISDVVFPLETHAEKDGTVTHPDGRLQRVRPSAGRPGDIRPNWGVLAELALALGQDTGVTSQPSAFAALADAAPIYAGLTDAEIGGRGVRWQDRPAASDLPAPAATDPGYPDTPPESGCGEPGAGGSDFKRGTKRDLGAGPITELNPPLKFLKHSQHLEVSPQDAERLSLASGDPVRVTQGDKSLEATVAIRERVPEGVCFLAEAVAGANANGLLNGHRVSVRIEKLSEVPA
jgi:NADH-quinone oxidoreductase subunit G